jgi:hypothetical protein
MYCREIEEKISCNELLNGIEKEFKEYLLKKNAECKTSAETFGEIKKFFAEKKYTLDKRGTTRLRGTDCLTLSVLGVLLAGRRGIDSRVAIPRDITHALHAIIVYPEGKTMNVFNIAGRSIPKNPRVIGAKEISLRLRFISPFVQTANKIRAVFKKTSVKIKRIRVK